jgi:hypothetical protein
MSYKCIHAGKPCRHHRSTTWPSTNNCRERNTSAAQGVHSHQASSIAHKRKHATASRGSGFLRPSTLFQSPFQWAMTPRPLKKNSRSLRSRLTCVRVYKCVRVCKRRCLDFRAIYVRECSLNYSSLSLFRHVMCVK